MTTTAVERNRVYRRRKAQLEAVREELRQCLSQVDPRFTRELIPSRDVRMMLRSLLETVAEGEG